MALSSLPVSVCDAEFYKDRINKAKNLVGERDPDDIHLLALSLKLLCPVWSNDWDFDLLFDVLIFSYSFILLI